MITLSELETGQHSRVATVLEEGHDILAFIDSLGLRPGAEVEMRQKLPFDGPLVMLVDGVERTVGYNLANIITVVPVAGLAAAAADAPAAPASGADDEDEGTGEAAVQGAA